MTTIFPCLKKKQEDFDWSAFDETKEKTVDCLLCTDIDWQDQDELNICKACGCVTERPLDMGALSIVSSAPMIVVVATLVVWVLQQTRGSRIPRLAPLFWG